ncbi:hypothetical protein [Anaerostipes sp.]|uniref:hypothetical protein n=1 Tax=Anaerostipes sp. TaxID=1872530 RepID=UPI0025C36F97|nr:hypothetical protein [Anaerostipes sp.]MBS7006939.1 hypothetical protein [Anaerostipes sp.]
MVKFDFDTKNFQLLAKEVELREFYKGNFYYVDSTTIYKIDLQTSEKKLVRGQKWSKKFLKSDDIVYYQGVMRIKGKLYYACYQGKWVFEGAAPSKLYLYKENRKDVKKYDASVTLFHPVYNGEKIVYHKVNIKKNKLILVIYDLKTGQERWICQRISLRLSSLSMIYYYTVQIRNLLILYLKFVENHMIVFCQTSITVNFSKKLV